MYRSMGGHPCGAGGACGREQQPARAGGHPARRTRSAESPSHAPERALRTQRGATHRELEEAENMVEALEHESKIARAGGAWDVRGMHFGRCVIVLLIMCGVVRGLVRQQGTGVVVDFSVHCAPVLRKRVLAYEKRHGALRSRVPSAFLSLVVERPIGFFCWVSSIYLLLLLSIRVISLQTFPLNT